MDAKATENVQQHRFELPIADGAFAAAYYRIDNGRVVLIHTEVPSEFSGRGIASQLAHGTFELLRATGRKAIPRCPFIGRFLIKNPQYSDIVAG
ncbi:MAG: N-acetyltransferase [Mesorhizobium sp.]|uniref:GNAT family N-acetyltransferase n=1 Tax=Mesorhizobium sp. TaxID=1871066 RepID=UPI001228C9C3|nr:GNAT family N-acetyltransferase [Mesorhizobium sp.]TIL34785.1 MAG: N-acetyltransferase [Mesorhizobium sp.]TIM46558.1 MAG: N-acetyltransferase [Mesorhizobium sp.]